MTLRRGRRPGAAKHNSGGKMIVKAPTWWDGNIKVATKTPSGDGDDLLPLWNNSTLPKSDASPLT